MKGFRRSTIVFAICALRLSSERCNGQDPFWKPSHGPYGGNVIALAAGPEGEVVAGAENGGISISTDHGRTWSIAGLQGKSVLSIICDSAGHVLAGTAKGIMSAPQGKNPWDTMGLENEEIFSLMMLSEGTILAGTHFHGIYRSDDNGRSWIQAGLAGSFIRSLSKDRVGRILAGVAGGGVFRSTNDGHTWSPLGLESKDVWAVVTDSVGTLYVGTYQTGVFRSTDDGANWSILGFVDAYVGCLAVTPSQEVVAGAYQRGIFRSTDSGQTWRELNAGLNNNFVRSLVADDHGFVLAGHGDGVSLLTPGTGTWERTGLPVSHVVSVAISRDSVVFAAASGYGSGVSRSTDGGESWTLLRLAEVGDFALAIGPRGDVFAGLAGGGGEGIFHSTDRGNSWELIDTGVLHPDVSSFAIDRKNNMFAGPRGVMRSTDYGRQWEQMGLNGLGVKSLTVSSRGSVFAGTYNPATGSEGAVYKSTDAGVHWLKMWQFPDAVAVTAMASSPDGSVFGYANNFIYDKSVLYRSTDDGETWAGTGFRITGLSSLLIDRAGRIFAGVNDPATGTGGVFCSVDNGEKWTEITSGLSSSAVSSLAISPAGYLFAGTDGCGVARSILPVYSIGPETSVDSKVDQEKRMFSLSQNYPNPFNPTTRIRFSIPSHDVGLVGLPAQAGLHVALKVYDVLGREVTTLVNEEKLGGTYEVIWDASRMSSGIYYCRLMVGTLSQTRKLQVLK